MKRRNWRIDLKRLGKDGDAADNARKLRADAIRKLRTLNARGASVSWAGRRWFVGYGGLEPADRKWGDLAWKEMPLGELLQIVERVRAEWLETVRVNRENREKRWGS